MKCRYCYNEFYEETQIYMTCNKCQHIISNYKPYHHNYKPEFEFEFEPRNLIIILNKVFIS